MDTADSYKILFKYLGLCLLLAFFISVLYSGIEKMNWTIRPAFDLPSATIQKYGFIKAFLLMIIVFPFVEEVAFRGFLVYKRFLFSISVSLLLYYLVTSLSATHLFDLALPVFLLKAIPCLLLFFIVYLLLGNSDRAASLKEFMSRNSSLLFWLSIILFALPHLYSYKYSALSQFAFTPLIIGPQLITGFFLTKIRISRGLRWSYQLHALINCIATLPVFIIQLKN